MSTRFAVGAVLAVVAGALAAGPGAAAPVACRATPSDGSGPFDRSAEPSPRRGTIGTGHVLLGKVTEAGSCRPVAGALVELWQAGPNGYDRRGRGSVVTGKDGSFRFQGPVPGGYRGIAGHIHVAVSKTGYRSLLTEFRVRPGARVERVTYAIQPFL